MSTLREPVIYHSFPFWKFNTILWMVLAVFGFGLRVFLHQNIMTALCFTLVQESTGFLLSGMLFLVFRHYSLGDPFGLQAAFWMIGLSTLAAVIQTLTAHTLSHQTGWNYVGWTMREAWFFRMTFSLLIYLVWSLAFFALLSKYQVQKESRRAGLAMQQRQQMELRLLRAQLDPHFLFNSLNSIAAEILPNPHTALEILHELSDYLRFSLDHRYEVLTPLSKELDAISSYLRIEKARFGERVRFELKTDEKSGQRMVPSFLLQPLVENAVKHGLHGEDSDWFLIIETRLEAGSLRVEVRNTGQLADENRMPTGVGLETLLRRLDLHYPKRHHFSLKQEGELVCAKLELEGEPCCE